MQKPARLRQRLQRLVEQHRQLLEVAFERSPLWKGLVHEARRKCGKPTCHCAKGELHVSELLADRSGPRQRNLAVKGKDLDLFREMTEAYRQVRRRRARLVQVQRDILQVFDALEAARRHLAERRYAKRLPARSLKEKGPKNP